MPFYDNYTPKFKAICALEMLTGRKTAEELSKEHGISIQMLENWEGWLFQKGYVIFEKENGKRSINEVTTEIPDKPYLERMKELRLQYGYSQKEAAKILGMARDTYARYEKGVNELPIKSLVKLCEIYQVSADYMLGIQE